MTTKPTGRGRGGHNVKLRPIKGEVVQPGGAPTDNREHEWWDRIWQLGRGWIAESDGPKVRLVAETLAERDRLREWLVAQPLEQRWPTAPNGTIATHPAVNQLRTLDAQAASWLGALGFTPQSRAQLKLHESDAAHAMNELRQLRGLKPDKA